MRPPHKIVYEFVDLVPANREEGKLYVSIKYATAIHNCFCGCGLKVVTPIHPTGWKLTFDGDSVSLSPSIGNSSFPCRSHYWVERNMVQWDMPMTPESIARAKAADRADRDRYFNPPMPVKPVPPTQQSAEPIQPVRKRSLWDRLFGRPDK